MSFPSTLANKISQASTRQLQQRVIVAEYGDGYSQAAGVGINSRYDEWTVTLEYLNTTQRTEFLNWYATVGLVQTWTWTPPGQTTPLKFRITEAPTESNVANYFTYTFTARQVY